jgi:hypothetical protein
LFKGEIGLKLFNYMITGNLVLENCPELFVVVDMVASHTGMTKLVSRGQF